MIRAGDTVNTKTPSLAAWGLSSRDIGTQVGKDCLAQKCCKRALWNCNMKSEVYLSGEEVRNGEEEKALGKEIACLKAQISTSLPISGATSDLVR